MCPACIASAASAASVAVGVTSGTGLMALVVTLRQWKPGARKISSEQEKSKTQKEK